MDYLRILRQMSNDIHAFLRLMLVTGSFDAGIDAT